jgi:hypothetical protein
LADLLVGQSLEGAHQEDFLIGLGQQSDGLADAAGRSF